ncbi:MAG: DUF3280 domain-containing protein [Methylocystis sp.]|uniref:DUF3280 domain-containing protein n=1 Tax=Methylocystis sp. TaxID=1911079 RepID=UPI003D10785A
MIGRRGLLGLALLLPLAGAAPAVAEEPRARLLVLDFELIDTSNEPVDQTAEHARRLARARDDLAAGLAARRVYDVVDRTAIAADLDAILKQTYIRTCNGCELSLARKAGADLVLTGVVNKVSTLILSMGVSITRVSTGELIYHQGFDFRGDNDQSWARATKFLVDRIARHPPV